MSIVKKLLSIVAVATLLSTTAFARTTVAIPSPKEVIASPKLKAKLESLLGREIPTESAMKLALKDAKEMSPNYRSEFEEAVVEYRAAEKATIKFMKTNAKGLPANSRDFVKAIYKRGLDGLAGTYSGLAAKFGEKFKKDPAQAKAAECGATFDLPAAKNTVKYLIAKTKAGLTAKTYENALVKMKNAGVEFFRNELGDKNAVESENYVSKTCRI